MKQWIAKVKATVHEELLIASRDPPNINQIMRNCFEECHVFPDQNVLLQSAQSVTKLDQPAILGRMLRKVWILVMCAPLTRFDRYSGESLLTKKWLLPLMCNTEGTVDQLYYQNMHQHQLNNGISNNVSFDQWIRNEGLYIYLHNRGLQMTYSRLYEEQMSVSLVFTQFLADRYAEQFSSTSYSYDRWFQKEGSKYEETLFKW